METAKTLEIAVTLRDKLLAEEADDKWIFNRKLLRTLITLQTNQKNYEGMQATGNGGCVDFSGAGNSMTEEARLKLKEAKAIDKQMGKILRERRSAKNNNIC